ncbi:FHA domain/tetratricopeptide repeat protein [Plesiocystis pacifica SIR-1]|uniref:FHA domain/tetratricopeptide repeat protein n=1 Tax=Plesiocystis pacifica SIR-1 TaxID=391625 RepID=A6GE51_9BACT|nr:FHA domain-containing protein [Plesiocystis pacifica]EDM75842.1 FHA domain/tetratricopeptide repeat protein [Plesiocystis pacifica SIR-1]
MAVRLIIEDLDGSTTVVPLDDEEVTIGRKEHNTIQLTEQNVSRSHAKLQFHDEGWLIEDLGSYNGVKVNGVPIAEPALLRESDLIQIGDYHLTLTNADPTTVDLNRRGAANDGMGAVDLPSMSVEDLAPMGALGSSSSPSAVTQPSMPVIHPETEDEDEGGNKTGLIVGVVLLLLGVVGIGAFMMGRGSGDTTDESTTASSADAGADAGAAPAADAGATPPADAGAGADAGAAPAADAGADTGEVIPEVDSGGEPEPVAETGEPASDEVVPEVEDPAPTPTKKKKAPKKKAPSTPVDPSLSPDQALNEARKAMMGGNNKKAYALAKQAYDGGKGAAAMSIMGTSACKMGSKSKAKSAHKKLSGSKQKDLEKVCEAHGITF